MNLRGTSKILYFFRIIRIFPSYLYEPCNNQRARYFESDRNRSIRIRSVSIRQFHVEIFHRNARGGKKEKSIVQPIIARCAGLSFKSPSQASDTFDLYILDKSDQPWGPRIDSRKPTFAFRKNSPKPRFPSPSIPPSYAHRYIRSFLLPFFSSSSFSGNQSRRPFLYTYAQHHRSPSNGGRDTRRNTIRWKVLKKKKKKKTLPTIPTSWIVSRWRGGYLLVIRMIDIFGPLTASLSLLFFFFFFFFPFSSSFMLEEFLLFTSC